MNEKCELLRQGYRPGKCLVYGENERGSACEITLRIEKGTPFRLIKSAHLSRPEHYLSVYQSGCNLECLKCHSWEFSQHATGEWLSPDDILRLAEEYATSITCYEPRERATSYHALDLCRGCGICIQPNLSDLLISREGRDGYQLKSSGKRGRLCPERLDPQQIVLSPQGFGPARNIIAFTGGDIGCKPVFYARCAEKIKESNLPLWVLFETNGYGLTPENLDTLRNSGIDSYWLDIKAYNSRVHESLTGVPNEWILQLPGEIVKRDFVLEVLTLFIPGWVEEDQLRKIAEIVAAVDRNIPFTILAFFPEYRMKDVPPPDLDQMLRAYDEVIETGLINVRLANLGVFVKSDREFEILLKRAPEAI